MIKKGETILFNADEYDSYNIYGPYQALKDFDLSKAINDFNKTEHKLDGIKNGLLGKTDEGTEAKLAQWLLDNQYVTILPSKVLSLQYKRAYPNVLSGKFSSTSIGQDINMKEFKKKYTMYAYIKPTDLEKIKKIGLPIGTKITPEKDFINVFFGPKNENLLIAISNITSAEITDKESVYKTSEVIDTKNIRFLSKPSPAMKF